MVTKLKNIYKEILQLLDTNDTASANKIANDMQATIDQLEVLQGQLNQM